MRTPMKAAILKALGAPLAIEGLMAFFLGLAAVFAVRFGDWTA